MVKFSKGFPCFPSIMDGNSSDNSHSYSEIGGEIWAQGWEHELNLSGLNLGNSLGLQGLVDDKEIAARAVAFVVSSTRKGIVPLCADIATLLRSKQCLEKKILMLRNENALLRSSASGSIRTSQSASPTPASLNSYSDKPHFNNDSLQNGDGPSRPCSRCSQCSSTLSNSPKLEKGQCFLTNDLQPSPLGSDLGSEVVTSKPENGVITEAVVHVRVEDEVNNKLRVADSSRSKGESSLPEITSDLNEDVRKIRPGRKMVSRETQCSMSRKREQAKDKTMSDKETSLSEDLEAAKKEIEALKARLREIEMSQNVGEPKYYVENELSKQKPSTAPKPVKSGSQSSSPRGLAKPSAPPKQLRLASISQPLNSQNAPVDFLPGCKCESCQLTSGDGGELFPLNEAKKSTETHKIRINSKLELKVGDHVLTKDNASGYVRYLGHVDRSGQPHTVYAGLSLDAPLGECDGFIHGKRYFLCHRDHGIFLPLEDIVCGVASKVRKKEEATGGATASEESGKVSKTTGKASKKSGSQSYTKLGDRLTLMLQKSRGKVSERSLSNQAAERGDNDDGPISTSSPTPTSPRGDKQWLGPYSEISRSPREGPVV